METIQGSVYLCQGKLENTHLVFEFLESNLNNKMDSTARIPLSPEQSLTKRYCPTALTLTDTLSDDAVVSDENFCLQPTILRKDSRKDRMVEATSGSRIGFVERVQVYTYITPRSGSSLGNDSDSEIDLSDDEEENLVTEPWMSESLRSSPTNFRNSSPTAPRNSLRGDKRRALSSWVQVAPPASGAQGELIEKGLESCTSSGWAWNLKHFFLWSCQTESGE